MTLPTDSFPPEQPPTGWWASLVRFVVPAFYTTSWAPWLRIMATAIVVVLAIVILRITPAP